MNKRKHIYSMQTGFTLIEIMVVVVILGILAAVVIPSIMDRPDHARKVKAETDIRTITSALNIYRMENSSYPYSLDELTNGSPKYLERVPKDPWGSEYQYEKNGYRGGGNYDLYSYGSDGKEGGNDLESDIGNWNLE